MARTHRRSSRSLSSILATDPEHFSLLQAAKILAAMDDRPVRYRSHVSAAFPDREVVAVQHALRGKDGAALRKELETGVISLFGPQGPLPDPVAEGVMRRLAEREDDARRFFDIFGHRIVELFVEVMRLDFPAASLTPPAEIGHGQAMAALAGYLGLERTDPVRRARTGFAGLLHQRPNSIEAANRVLSRFTGAPVQLRAATGAWLPLAPGLSARLGSVPGTGAVLGTTSALGKRTFLAEAGMSLSAGPVDRATYRRFLPGGEKHRDFAQVTRSVVPDGVDVHCTLTLHAEDRRAMPLLTRPLLGYSSWLGRNRLANEAGAGFRLLPTRKA